MSIHTGVEINATRKVYIVLFTCAVTRAVHIEEVEDLSRESFLKAIRRFCGRILLSDSATYFVAASEYLKEP